jgi:hypothetical protein
LIAKQLWKPGQIPLVPMGTIIAIILC